MLTELQIVSIGLCSRLLLLIGLSGVAYFEPGCWLLHFDTEMTIVPLQAVGSPLGTATTAVVSSVLLSPSVFQQTVTRTTDLERKASSSSPLTVGTSENQRKPSIILSKSQLQDTLIHLIKVCSL